jgi:glycosyltransferase involved in cell wall biosynthesis
MNTQPIVTIFCLCYNHEKYVVEALNSVIDQNYKNIELIIADDCSSDNSVAVIENWLQNHTEVKFIKNNKNIGNTKTFNSIFHLAKGEYIIDFATDDILLKNTLELQLKTFENSKFNNLGIVYGNVEIVDPDGKHLSYFFEVDEFKKRKKAQPTGDIYLGLIGMKNNVCSVSSMVKREVYEKLNAYDETLCYEDYDFWIRAARNFSFEFIDEIIFKKRTLPNSLSATRYKRFNKKMKLFNQSTYKMIVKNLHLNQTIEEHKASFKMINYELNLAMRTLNINLFFKYLILIGKLKLKGLKNFH